MKPINRQNCIAVLLVLLLSHAALILHVSTHSPVDSTSCDYCAGHSDPGHALNHSLDEFPVSSAISFDVVAVASILRATTFHSYQQRAPPVLI